MIYFTTVGAAGKGRTYRVACQIVGTPAFPPAKVLQVVQVVDARRKRHLSADCIKLLHAQVRQRWAVQRNQRCSPTNYTLKYSCLKPSYLIEAAHRLIRVTVTLCTNVRSGQTVALPINLLPEAQSAHLGERAERHSIIMFSVFAARVYF